MNKQSFCVHLTRQYWPRISEHCIQEMKILCYFKVKVLDPGRLVRDILGVVNAAVVSKMFILKQLSRSTA